VSEGAGYLLVNVESRAPGSLYVTARTIDGEAKAPGDYEHTELTHEFTKSGEKIQMKIPIKDDDEWEPDKDFYIELFGADGERLVGEDTKCRVTIIDDDRPGCLAFAANNMKQASNEKICKVNVDRIHAFDGHVTVKYKT
jgi:solute carrier family 8 (sodium/calcium exchanger)